MPDWVIRSKLQPTIRLRNLVTRPNLVERLESAFDARLVLVHAPAGYGKSTCLAQWRKSLLDRNIAGAWLSLDEHDADLFQFQTYLSEACCEARFLGGRDFPKFSEGFSGLSGSEIAAALATGLNRCVGPHVIILDDFHRAHSAPVLQFVSFLLGACPANVLFVISTREVPSSLPIADLRIHDELVEITQDDLRFSTDEIRTYLNFWAKAPQNPDWPDKLQERTEGWPVALQTVRRWASEGTSIDQTIDQLSGRTSDLADYFLEQVFDSLSDDARRFLLTTSILERVCGELGSVLCKGVDGWQILQDLDHKDMFVQSLDRQRNWYRYHRLFSEFLQERLHRSVQPDLQGLHLKASEWFRQHGYKTEAVQHALASGDAAACAALLEELGGWHYALQGHVAVVQNVLASLAGQQLRDYPRLWLAKVYLAIRLGQMEFGEAEIARFEQACLQADSVDTALAAEAQVIKATIMVYGDQPVSDEVVASLELLGEQIPMDNHVLHATRSNLLCAMYRDIGRYEDCMAIGDQAISHYRAMGSMFETFIYFHEGLACLRQARVRDAESLYREGFEIALEFFGERSDLAAIGSAFLAEVSYEKNRLHEARQYLEDSTQHIERADAWIDVYLAAYLTRMKLAWAAGDTLELEETASRARSTAIHRGLGRLAQIIDLQRQELLLKDASGEQAEIRAPIEVPPASDEISHQFAARIHARRLMLAGEHGKACRYLEDEARQARENRQVLYFISLAVLLAAARWLDGDRESAIRAFEAALSAAIFEGIKRPFIDEGGLIKGVIHQASQAIQSRRSNRLRDAFIAELIAEINASGDSKAAGDHLLSPREREVLRFLMQGQSNREIADAMPLSINTVKFHIKNIFEKLGVSSRKDAVSAAIRDRLV